MQLETFVHRNPKQFVFHMHRKPASEPSLDEVRGHSLLHWTNGGLSYWAVSDAAQPELEAFREAYMH
jgi:anti-sigma factor RsiW